MANMRLLYDSSMVVGFEYRGFNLEKFDVS